MITAAAGRAECCQAFPPTPAPGGGVQVLTLLMEARADLVVALMQTLPTDGQIVMDLVRAALARLDKINEVMR